MSAHTLCRVLPLLDNFRHTLCERPFPSPFVFFCFFCHRSYGIVIRTWTIYFCKYFQRLDLHLQHCLVKQFFLPTMTGCHSLLFEIRTTAKSLYVVTSLTALFASVCGLHAHLPRLHHRVDAVACVIAAIASWRCLCARACACATFGLFKPIANAKGFECHGVCWINENHFYAGIVTVLPLFPPSPFIDTWSTSLLWCWLWCTTYQTSYLFYIFFKLFSQWLLTCYQPVTHSSLLIEQLGSSISCRRIVGFLSC